MATAPLWLIVGLGNPGPTYATHRHNIGHMVIDALAHDVGPFSSFRGRSGERAEVVDGRLGTLPGGAPGPRVILAKPAAYMNLSGPAVAALANYYEVPPPQVLIVHDELDLPPHELRLKSAGGEGGHNGLKSVSQALGTREYSRLRVGIGRPPARMDPAAFVLQPFAVVDRPEVAVTIAEAADVIRDVVYDGFRSAQDSLHSPS